jgi:hypothetical protein
MDSGVSQTIDSIREKLDWAIRSLDRIKRSNDSKIVIQDNFWSFITAFQQAWYYYNNLIQIKTPEISSKQRNEIGKHIIERWKMDKLTGEEKISWDILQAIRNYDTHTEPILPIIIERETMLIDDVGTCLVDDQGRVLSLGKTTQYFVYLNKNEYEILQLANNGIKAIKKLLDLILTLS